MASRYELLEPAGAGGMAVVWRGLDHGGEGPQPHPVAIKRMLPTLMGDPDFARMFAEEARVVASLAHPHVVRVDQFLADRRGGHFIVMEWVEGLDLGRLVRAHRAAARDLPWPAIALLGAQVLRALEAGHGRVDAEGREVPVFHRDVTPSNVLIRQDGVAKLTDFGLARAMDRVTITGPGIIKGKLAYVAPELVAGRRASAQSDLYSLGVVLWEALAGRRLFEGKNDVELFAAVGRGGIPRLGAERDDLPVELQDVVARAVARRASQRFGTAGAMADALEALARAGGASREGLALLVTEAREHEALRPLEGP